MYRNCREDVQMTFLAVRIDKKLLSLGHDYISILMCDEVS